MSLHVDNFDAKFVYLSLYFKKELLLQVNSPVVLLFTPGVTTSAKTASESIGLAAVVVELTPGVTSTVSSGVSSWWPHLHVQRVRSTCMHDMPRSFFKCPRKYPPSN